MRVKAIVLAVLMAAVLAVPVAVADEPAPYAPTANMVLFVTPDGVATVPLAFAMGAAAVIQCESRWNTNAVGAAGELGWLQTHPVHFPRMRSLGLDPYREADRIFFAGNYIWQASGWAPWSCSK